MQSQGMAEQSKEEAPLHRRFPVLQYQVSDTLVSFRGVGWERKKIFKGTSKQEAHFTFGQRVLAQTSTGGSAKHGSTFSHPSASGLILQKSSTGTPAAHAKHCAMAARQQNVISQKDSSLHPYTGSSTKPGGQMHPVTHTVGHGMSWPKLSHVVGHGLAQSDHVPPEHSQIS